MTGPKPLIAIGASGHMKDVAFIVEGRERVWNLVGVLDDDPALQGNVCAGHPVLGTISRWKDYEDHWFVIAVGSPRLRAQFVERMQKEGSPKFATLIHSAALYSRTAKIGQGCMIGPGAVISREAEVGNHVIVNAAATIAHDDRVGNFVTIAPQAAISGNVTIEDGVEIGTNASIRQGLRIGEGAMIGMGAVVTADVPPNICVIGNPARKLKDLPAFGAGR